MSHLAYPVASARMAAFFVFGAVTFCLALLPMVFAFSPYLEIQELSDDRYYASFKSADYAHRFAALNRETTRATVPSGDK